MAALLVRHVCGLPLFSGLMLRMKFTMSPTSFLREAVVDPARHGGALDAVEHGVEQAAVIDAGDEGRIAQVARVRQDVERVGSFAVGLAAVAAGAALQEDLLAVR